MSLSRSADLPLSSKWVLRELQLADRPLTPGQLQSRMGIPESTLHDALLELVEEELVTKNRDRGGDARRTRYRPQT